MGELRDRRLKFYAMSWSRSKDAAEEAFRRCKFVLPSLNWTEDVDILHEALTCLNHDAAMVQSYRDDGLQCGSSEQHLTWMNMHRWHQLYNCQYITSRYDAQGVLRVVVNQHR